MGNNLTPEQKQVCEINLGRVLVSAGAGSGKTRVLVERFVRLVREKRAQIDEILLVTFTEKAAKEMKERIWNRFEEEKMDEECERFGLASIGTIHSFCAKILAENPLKVPIPSNYYILDEVTHGELLEEILTQKCEEVYKKEGHPMHELFETYGFSALFSGLNHAFKQLRSVGLLPKQLTKSLFWVHNKFKIST